MAFEQHPDCFSARLGNQLPLDRLLGDQAHGPTRPPLRRLAADHGHDALFLGVVQQWLGTGPLPVVESAVQTPAVVTVSLDPAVGGQQRVRNRASRGAESSEDVAQEDWPAGMPGQLLRTGMKDLQPLTQ